MVSLVYLMCLIRPVHMIYPRKYRYPILHSSLLHRSQAKTAIPYSISDISKNMQRYSIRRDITWHSWEHMNRRNHHGRKSCAVAHIQRATKKPIWKPPSLISYQLVSVAGRFFLLWRSHCLFFCSLAPTYPKLISRSSVLVQLTGRVQNCSSAHQKKVDFAYGIRSFFLHVVFVFLFHIPFSKFLSMCSSILIYTCTIFEMDVLYMCGISKVVYVVAIENKG